VNALAFINNCQEYFGQWPTEFKRKEVFEYVKAGYTEKDIDILYTKCTEQVSEGKQPTIHILRGILPPLNKSSGRAMIEAPCVDFTTETAREWGEQLHDFWDRRLPGDDCKSDSHLSVTEKAQMKSRADAYFNILGKLWGYKTAEKRGVV
jgi:hypothetical protein